LIAQSALFIGVDSGPLHVAGAVLEDGLPSPSRPNGDGDILPLPLGSSLDTC
jgi:hypothetical protein